MRRGGGVGGWGVESVRECTLALDEGEIGCWELRLDVKGKVRILENGRECKEMIENVRVGVCESSGSTDHTERESWAREVEK